MDWARILAYVTGTVDQELLARNEYLAAEKLSDAEAQIAPAQGSAASRDASHRYAESVGCQFLSLRH
jgi:hypothetical protein